MTASYKMAKALRDEKMIETGKFYENLQGMTKPVAVAAIAALLAEAELERDYYKQRFNEQSFRHLREMENATTTADQEIARLRAALAKYGDHQDEGCFAKPGQGCVCGLDDAMDRKPRP